MKDIKKLFKKLVRQNWRVNKGKGHYKCYPPNKEKSMVVVSATTVNCTALKRIISDLKRSGYKIN